MRQLLALAVVLSAFAATPAFAADGNVPAAVLNDLQLGGMTFMSDEAGTEIRGRSGNAMAMGLSVISGVLYDPSSKSYIFGTDANSAMSSAENAGLQVLTQATSSQQSAVNLDLNVTSPNVFSGFLTGGAGGNANAWSQ